ncbi:MAG: hypothetical protein ACOC1P_02420, partial [Minisyncoccales bacterium]
GKEEELRDGDDYTYHFKADVNVDDDAEVTVRVDEDSEANDGHFSKEGDNFSWSDQSYGYQDHDSSTGDWMNGYMVEEFPTTKRYLIE